jgi:hypothetical protein
MGLCGFCEKKSTVDAGDVKLDEPLLDAVTVEMTSSAEDQTRQGSWRLLNIREAGSSLYSSFSQRQEEEETEETEQPMFDGETGFPTNDAAKQSLAKGWRARDALEYHQYFDSPKTIDFEDIKAATDDFDRVNKIGSGGSCKVYKGRSGEQGSGCSRAVELFEGCTHRLCF